MNHLAPRRTVPVALDADLLRRAEELGVRLDEVLGAALARAIACAEQARAHAEMIDLLNEMDAKHGAFADQHSTLR